MGIVFSYEIALADYPMENLYVTEQGAALDAILKTVFTPRGIDYRVVDKVVVLTRSAHPAQTVKAAPAKAQVTGVVRDAAGNPMIGVTVTIKGTLVGVSTGVDGSYTIPADKDAMLLFSYIGYRNQEELVGQRHPDRRHDAGGPAVMDEWSSWVTVRSRSATSWAPSRIWRATRWRTVRTPTSPVRFRARFRV